MDPVKPIEFEQTQGGCTRDVCWSSVCVCDYTDDMAACDPIPQRMYRSDAPPCWRFRRLCCQRVPHLETSLSKQRLCVPVGWEIDLGMALSMVSTRESSLLLLQPTHPRQNVVTQSPHPSASSSLNDVRFNLIDHLFYPEAKGITTDGMFQQLDQPELLR